MANFQKIRQEIPIEEAARWLGIEVLNGKERCPFHKDQTPSLSFKEGRFKCFGCNASGDAIDLTAKLRHVSTIEAARLIRETFHLCTAVPPQKKGGAGACAAGGIHPDCHRGVCGDAARADVPAITRLYR